MGSFKRVTFWSTFPLLIKYVKSKVSETKFESIILILRILKASSYPWIFFFSRQRSVDVLNQPEPEKDLFELPPLPEGKQPERLAL